MREVSRAGGLTRLEIERDGVHAETLEGLSDDDVIAALGSAASDPDVTIVLIRDDLGGRLLAGLDRGRVFMAKEHLGELFQFAADTSPRGGGVAMRIGGQETQIDARNVTSFAILEVVTREWLSGSADIPGGYWERP